MAVVIEQVHTDEAVPAPAPAAQPAAEQENVPVERTVLETLTLETWALQRLRAD